MIIVPSRATDGKPPQPEIHFFHFSVPFGFKAINQWIGTTYMVPSSAITGQWLKFESLNSHLMPPSGCKQKTVY
jgi:hypothetical protein